MRKEGIIRALQLSGKEREKTRKKKREKEIERKSDKEREEGDSVSTKDRLKDQEKR